MSDEAPTKTEFRLSQYQAPEDGPVRDAITKFGAQFGEDRIVVVDTERGTAIFRAPSVAEYQRFKEGVLNDSPAKKAIAGETIVKNTVVFPEKPVFLSWLDTHPAITTGALKYVTGLAGGEVRERGKE